MSEARDIFTIGHSTHTMAEFLRLLATHRIGVVVDVRSSPYSRFQPQFNREALAAALKQGGLRYVFLGEELGGRAKDESAYRNGRVVYEVMRRAEPFRAAVERLRTGAAEHRIALMCAEKEPLECHRALLVAPALEEAKLRVLHLHADGSVETHEQAMRRLLAETGDDEEDLFASEQERIAIAVRKQAGRFAFVDEERKRAEGEAPG